MDGEPDEHLLRRVVRGNEEALLLLYRRYAPHVHALARRILRDGEAAKEVVQDTFLRIWRKAERFDPALGTPRTWILTIGHRLALKAQGPAHASRGPFGHAAFGARPLAPGAVFRHTFTEPGAYTLYCRFHPYMVMDLRVG